MKILIVDDEKSICDLLEIVFKREGYDVRTASSARLALDLLAKEPVDLIVSDIRMPGLSGLDLLREVRATMPDVVFIFMTAFASTSTAIQALRSGANNYIIKTETFVDELKVVIEKEIEELKVRQENRTLRRELGRLGAVENLIGGSAKMRALGELIHTVAATSSTVLITGESGTGKELVARAIHHLSSRGREHFTSINCGAFPETLLESELFGYVKGAFTGANANKKGLFEVSDRGTVFLDEIGEMSSTMQVKLLRVLQDRKVRPVGGTEEIAIDVRVIAATNRDLQKMVAEKNFREDLFYRISVIPIAVPPLRERIEDIRVLTDHFVQRFGVAMNKKVNAVEPDVYEALESYEWPGNVRELENTIERAIAFETTETLQLERLPERIVMPKIKIHEIEASFPDDGIDFDQQVSEVERKLVESALRKADGVQTKAAELLKMTYRSFRHYMAKYNLQK